MLRKIIKIGLKITAGIMTLVLLLLFLLWAGLFNGIIAGIISNQAGKSINGELKIESIQGSLFSDFSVNGLLLTSGEDTLLYTQQITVDYALLPLIRKELRIHSVRIADASAFLKQDKDSLWNFQKLIPESSDTDSAVSKSSWKITLGELRARRLTAQLMPIDTAGMIPAFIETGFRLNASVDGDTILADLDSLAIHSSDPDFNLNSLSGNFSKNADIIRWSGVELNLDKTIMLTEGNYSASDGSVEAFLDLLPLDLEEISKLIPDLEVYGSPDISISVTGDESGYSLSMNLKEEEQSIDIEGKLSDLQSDTAFNFTLRTRDIDASHWTGNDSLKTHITGVVGVSGRGFDIKNNVMELTAEFESPVYNEYALKDLQVDAIKDKSRVTGSLTSGTFAGNIDLRYSLSGIFDNPAYDLTVKYNDVDIGNFPGLDSITSDLNGVLRVKGSGNSKENIAADLELLSDHSTITGEELGDFKLTGSYRRGDYIFNLEGFGAPYINFTAEGSGNPDAYNEINFRLEPVDPARIAMLFGLPELKAAGAIEGKIEGSIDSLRADITIGLDSINYDTISIADINSIARIGFFNKNLLAEINLATGVINAGEYSINSVNLSGNYNENEAGAELKIAVSDSLDVTFTGTVTGYDDPMIGIRQLGINYGSTEWSTPHDSAFIHMRENEIQVKNFSLASGNQEFKINGIFAFNGTEDITAQIINIDLSALPTGDMLPYRLSGFLNAEMALTGTASSPLVQGTIIIENLEANGIVIDTISTGITYDEDLISISGRVLTGLYESVDFSLDVPMHLSFTDSIAVLADNPGLAGSLIVEKIDLQKIAGIFPVDEVSFGGIADAEVEVANSLNDPIISGNISLEDGTFGYEEYGADYEDIQLHARIDNSKMSLDTLTMRSGKGTFAIGGNVSLENTDSLEMNEFNVNLKANDFQAVNSSSIELEFDSDLDLSGTLGKPAFKGKLLVNRSMINVDYFMEYLSQKSDQPDPPLLIEALKDTLEITAVNDSTSRPAFQGSEFYSNLEGEAMIDIPGNTWVKGKDMNFELEGSVRAVKASENISLFGDLNIKRGQYKIYGRNFDFERGKISFTGSAEFNPDVDFEITYSFRDIDKELRDLRLLITGKLMQPNLSFMLDDEAVEEKDAISYIVFGKSVNQLGNGERDKMSAENVALGTAVTQLSSALKGVLLESAGVDVFEVSGGDDWKSGNVTIGKYITNNLFLSYERSFDFNKQSKTADTEKIMLEYQIIRNLILKATNQEINSGFDLVWRKSWR